MPSLSGAPAWRLHRLHDPKREVVIYDYVDRDVPVLARMAAKRAAGYSAIGYTIAQGPGLFDSWARQGGVLAGRCLARD